MRTQQSWKINVLFKVFIKILVLTVIRNTTMKPSQVKLISIMLLQTFWKQLKANRNERAHGDTYKSCLRLVLIPFRFSPRPVNLSLLLCKIKSKKTFQKIMKGRKCTKFIHLRALYAFVTKPINCLATAENSVRAVVFSCCQWVNAGIFQKHNRKVLVSTLQTMLCSIGDLRYRPT